MTDHRIREAIARVPEEYYTRREEGGLVRQSSSVEAITSGLERLDVRPGMRVLEIGTGSGFSGALLAELVGEGGSVVSVDVVAELVSRARDLHARRGADRVRVVTGDGAEGVREHAPYDRIVAWASSDLLRRAWADQCVPGAVLVVPVTIAPLPRANAVVRAHRTREGRLEADRLWSGGYVEMHPEELTQWLVPPKGVDALTSDDEGHPWWFSGTGDGEPGASAAARTLLNALVAEARPGGAVLRSEESADDFRAYLYAAAEPGLSMFGLGARGWAPGHATAASDTGGDEVGSAAAVLADGELLTAGGPESAERMREWAGRWREAGRPGAEALVPALEGVADGWLVRARVPVPDDLLASGTDPA